MTFSPEVQAILNRVKTGEPELTTDEERERHKVERAKTPRPKPKPKPRLRTLRITPVGPHGSSQPSISGATQLAILEGYRNGATISGLAREFGHHPNTIRNCLKWHNAWEPGKQKGTPVKRDDLNPIVLLALHEQGMSARAIAKEVGASAGVVTRQLRALGAEIARTRPVQPVCQRGHEKGPGKCLECIRIRDRARRPRKAAAETNA